MAQKLIDTMPLAVVCFDPKFRITDSNPLAKQLLNSQTNLTAALEEGADQEHNDFWEKELRESLESRQTKRFEGIAFEREGRKQILDIICHPILGDDGQDVLGGMLLIENVTRRKVMEQDLAAAERLAAVGKLAARVAHELNNPLDGILRYINLALRVIQEEENPQAERYLQESRKGLLRMVQIISELLEFSRSTYSAFEEADINKIVIDAVKAMENVCANSGVEIIGEYQRKMPTVRSGNLFQVFCNLIKNASDAMPEGGKLEIRTRREEHSAIIEFSDTGTGIPAENLDKIFEPFFTTKEVGKGTGLGLAICKDIMERYGGRITAENRPQGGARFTISIPVEE